MNVILDNLFEKYNLSAKNRHDVRQIYYLLDDNKKINLINNFDALARSIWEIEETLEVEREILIWNAITNIRMVIEEVKREKLQK